MSSRSPNGTCKRSFTKGLEFNKKLKSDATIKTEKGPITYVKPQDPGRFSRNDQGVVSNCKDVVEHLNLVTEHDVSFLTKVDLLLKPHHSYHVIA